jgi:hypothetical protein
MSLHDINKISLKPVDIDVLSRVDQDSRAWQENEFFTAKQNLEIEFLREQLRQTKIDNSNRDRYATYFFRLAITSLITLLTIVIFQGFHIWDFTLRENVLLALIGGVFTEVVGLVYSFAKYLYKSPKE